MGTGAQGESGAYSKRVGYRLAVTYPDGATTRHDVGAEPITIGRATDCDIRFDELRVSRQHCLLHLRGGRLTVLDQGSTHGTVVNGVRTRHARLGHGDIVRVGSGLILVEAVGFEDGVLPPGASRTQIALSGARSVRETAAPIAAPGNQLRLVYRLAGLLANASDLRGVADAVLHLALEAFPVDRVAVLLGEKGGGAGPTTPFAIRRREGDEAPPGIVSRSVVERVLETGTALHSLDVRGDDRLAGAPSLIEQDLLVVMCAPLRHGDATLGALYADAKPGPGAPTEDQLALFEAIADQAALALGRARLHTELVAQHEVIKEQRDQLEALSRTLERRVAEKTAIAEERAIALAERLEELEQLQAARETMAQCLVHDVRNMVGAIDLALQYLAMTVSGQQRPEQAAAEALEMSKRIVSLVEDVLTASRMESGVIELRPRLVVVAAMLSSAVKRNTAFAREPQVDLVLGEATPGLAVMVDPSLMDRLLDNLIGNGIRYAGQGGKVTLSADYDDGKVEISVTDTGPGVKPEERGHVFEKWFQGGSRDAKHHGLGLHFCQLAAEAHGGLIRIDGEPGRNAFVVVVPARGALDEDDTTT